MRGWGSDKDSGFQGASEMKGSHKKDPVPLYGATFAEMSFEPSVLSISNLSSDFVD